MTEMVVKPTNAYGLYILLNKYDRDSMHDGMVRSQAEFQTDVMIEMDGESRGFTFDEFRALVFSVTPGDATTEQGT